AQREILNKEFAAHYKTEYALTFAELQQVLREVDPIQTLAHFVFYDLTIFEAYPELKSDYKGVGQHHVELLQALLLCIPRENQKFAPVTTDTFVKIGDLVTRPSEAFALRRFQPTGKHSQ